MGSPPHVRGKAQDLTDRQPVCWITPACAGKRRCKAAFCAWFWDHPRMCGEKASHSATLFGVGGSPPHVRGKVGRTLYLVAGERITPAYAGKSFLQRTAQCRCQDHPRVCGEKLDVFDTDKCHLGSPPRMRGKVLFSYSRMPPRRITPAYAGKRLLQSFGGIREWDHPRVCGEKTKKIP